MTKLLDAFPQLLPQATCAPFHGVTKGAGISVTYRKFLTDRHLIAPCSAVAVSFQRAAAVVDVAGHVGRVIAELHREVLPAGVPQLAVLSLAGTRGAQLLWDGTGARSQHCSPPALNSMTLLLLSSSPGCWKGIQSQESSYSK